MDRVIKFPYAPESATAASDDNVDTKIVDILFCKLLDTYCVSILVSAMFQPAVAYLKKLVVPPSFLVAVALSLCLSDLNIHCFLLWLHLHPWVQQ